MDKLQIHPSLLLAWTLANREAALSQSERIEPLHFLTGGLALIDGLYDLDHSTVEFGAEIEPELREISAACLIIAGISAEEATQLRRRLQLKLRTAGQVDSMRMLHRSSESRRLFDRAAGLMLEQNAASLTLEHLFRALRRSLPANLMDLPENLAAVRESLARDEGGRSGGAGSPPSGKKNSSVLDALGKDLTVLAAEGRLRDVVGRDKEISAILRILLRTSKRNVILVGEPGVGKTAIVEGLAQRLAGGGAPEELKTARIIQIALADLVAGTEYRGNLESRLKDLIREIEEQPGAVVFLDEIHLAMHSGAASNSSMDVANILKQALTRETFACIGATTNAEFDRYITADAAFMRRFHVIRVSEPDESQTLEICRVWAANLAKRTGVEIDESAITSAVQLSSQFIHDRRQPDKAIDLLEDAAAAVRMFSGGAGAASGAARIGAEQIKAVLEEQTGIRVDAQELDPSRIRDALTRLVIGHDEEIGQIASGLGNALSRPQADQGVRGVFLFSSPPGAPRKELVEAVAKAIFPNPAHIYSLDMVDFNQRQDLARLTGSPPGFVGFDQENPFFHFVSANAHGAVILNDLDQADASVQNYFAHVFESGQARDAKNRLFDVRNVLFLVTSAATGTETAAKLTSEVIRECNQVIQVKSTRMEDTAAVFEALFAELCAELDAGGMNLIQFDESSRLNALLNLVDTTCARPRFRQLFEQNITQPVRKFLAAHPGTKVQLAWTGNGIEASPADS